MRDWLTGYQHALSVPGDEARRTLMLTSKWSASRMRGFLVGSAEARRTELCAQLRVSMMTSLEQLRSIDPSSPSLEGIERNLVDLDHLQTEMLVCDWIEVGPEAN